MGKQQLLDTRPLNFSNTPFALGETRIMHCQFGDHYFKKKERNSSRVCIQGTRKIGSQAHVEIREYILYPEYSVNCTKTLSAWKTRTMCESKLEELWTSLKSGKEIKVEKKYFVSLPTEEAQQIGHFQYRLNTFFLKSKAHPLGCRRNGCTAGSTTPVFQVLRQ